MTTPTSPARRPPQPAGGDTCAVVVGRGELAAAAAEELTQVVGCIERAPDAGAVAAWEPPDGHLVALVVLIDHPAGAPVDDVVGTMLALPALARSRLLVVTTRRDLTDMSASVDSGRIDGVVAAPWTPGNLARYAEAQVSRARLLAGRPAVEEEHDSELLRRLTLGTQAAAAELLEALEDVLGPRPRVHLRAGVRITVPDGLLTQVFLVVRGRVALTVTSPAGEVVLHHASTGPLVGLLALTEMRHSTVTARTTTDCEMVSLTLEQLDYALTRDPRIGTALMALTMRALSTRLRRSEQLHLEKAALTAELRTTLAELEAAREGLVEQARLATLGELAAGVAHELNNPAATVTRGIEHLSADLRALLAGQPELEALLAAQERDHVSAREERALRRELGEVVADRSLVRRLVAAGVRERSRAQALVDGPPEVLARVESAAGIGSALRAVRVASRHIATLVAALHAHARPDAGSGSRAPHTPTGSAGAGSDGGGPADGGTATLGAAGSGLTEPTSATATLQDALRLLEHRLHAVSVDVSAQADLPLVLSGPGLLTQVWTNLLSNAADAVDRDEHAGQIAVRMTSREGVVRVEVEDDGPGVPEPLREQIFTPRFTTRHGVVRYGLGLGLGIARSIVTRHGGRIGLESEPGRTVFTVELPADGHPALAPTAVGPPVPTTAPPTTPKEPT